MKLTAKSKTNLFDTIKTGSGSDKLYMIFYAPLFIWRRLYKLIWFTDWCLWTCTFSSPTMIHHVYVILLPHIWVHCAQVEVALYAFVVVSMHANFLPCAFDEAKFLLAKTPCPHICLLPPRPRTSASAFSLRGDRPNNTYASFILLFHWLCLHLFTRFFLCC